VRQQRIPAVVTTLFEQTAPVFSWQQSSEVVHAHDSTDVHRLPSAALHAVMSDAAHAPPEQRPPQQS